MDVMKIFLLFFISIEYSISQKIEENQDVAEPRIDLNINYPPNSKGNCYGKFCKQIKSKYAHNERCTCFPLNNYNTPVLEYLTNGFEKPIERTVVYIYTVGKKNALYVPNLHKQSLFTDLTLDDGDVLRPLPSHNVNVLTALEELPQEENEDHSSRTNAHIITINENQPINEQNLQKSISPTSSERISKEALKHIFEDKLHLLASYEYPSSQDFDGIGESNLYDDDDSQSVFGIYPDEDDEYTENVEEPNPVLVSKPGSKNVLVDDTVRSQEKLYLNTGAVKEPSVFVSVEHGLDPIVNELFSHEVIKPKNIVAPLNIPRPNFGNIDLKPNAQQVKFPYKGFGYNEDENQSQNAFKPEPLNQAEEVLNINGPLAIPNLHNADRPVKVFESKPSEEIIDEHGKAPKIDYGLNLNKDYFPLYHNSKPQKIVGLNSNKNKKLVENIAKPQNLYGVDNLQPQNGFGFGSPWNTLPVDIYESTHSKELNLNSIYDPRRKVEIEIDEENLASASLIKHRPDISCSSGICKLHIYCSRYECPKYLKSISKLHTSIHKHPYLENTFVAINNVGGNENSTDSQLKSFYNLIGLENAENKIQNIHGVQLEEENPNNYLSHVQRKQVPRSIPMSFDPLFSTLKQGSALQSLPFSSPIKDQLVKFYPENKQILSTQILNPPQYRGIYFPMPHHDQHNNIKITPVTPNKKDPSQNLKIIPVTPEKKDSPKYRDIYFPMPHHDQKPNNIKITPVIPATPEKKDSPKYRGIYFPMPHNDQLVTPEKKDPLKDLLLLPSKIHNEGMKTVADLIPGLSLRRHNVVEEDVPDEIEVPVDEEDIKIKIIGGQPAVSSGTPMQIKARLGDI
ncbi:uncharacterized protein LOC121725850 [Aricia agestis]|uniref:uncharacterized protein LOC121725850 n=1 Tax=Aricia agestis TaxID=91739 RepID=UPI001C206417|nr:uncharacterized protein LOC121725850 [Aricia agestis]